MSTASLPFNRSMHDHDRKDTKVLCMFEGDGQMGLRPMKLRFPSMDPHWAFLLLLLLETRYLATCILYLVSCSLWLVAYAIVVQYVTPIQMGH